MRIKAIEAMAAGRPVVSTSLGMEGIHGTDGTHFFIADDANSFAQRIIDLHNNPRQAQEIGEAARAFIETEFSNEALIQSLYVPSNASLTCENPCANIEAAVAA